MTLVSYVIDREMMLRKAQKLEKKRALGPEITTIQCWLGNINVLGENNRLERGIHVVKGWWETRQAAGGSKLAWNLSF